MHSEEGSLLESSKGSDVDEVQTAQTRNPRASLMFIGVVGAATVLLCYMARSSAPQLARFRAVVGLAQRDPPFSDPGIKLENPEEFYTFGDELYKDQLTITKVVTKKDTGDKYLAEMFIFEDRDTAKSVEHAYHLRTKTLAGVKSVPEVIEAYMVQHYLILISPYVETKPVLEWMAAKMPVTEGEVAKLLGSIIGAVKEFHAKGLVHANINPWSVRVSDGGDTFLTSLVAVAKIAKKGKKGEIIKLIGDSEYVSPEGVSFEPLTPQSDVWSLGVLADTLLSGVSPFFDEEEEEVIRRIKKAQLPRGGLEGFSGKVAQVLKKALVRAPEFRPTIDEFLDLWQACESENSELDIKAQLSETNDRLLDELSEDAIWSCGPFKTFDEDEVDCEEEED